MPLLYEKRGAVAVLTLSRPQARNAWGEDYNAALVEMLPRLEDDPEIRCVVLTGDEAGGAFSAPSVPTMMRHLPPGSLALRA
jgi:enoyl-CoA hydratase/carnithine racemase